MQRLVTVALIGLFAQLIDGSLGMGYGVTASSLLLATGLAPVAASLTVHTAEIATTFAAGLSHWRFGNIDRRTSLILGLSGAPGAFLGAWFLALLPGQTAKPFVSAFLLLLGLRVLLQVVRRNSGQTPAPPRPLRRGSLVALGFLGGLLDASGGGGWGPVTASTLLVRPGAQPRKVVGSVDTSEFLVALAATLGFLLGPGEQALSLPWLFALMAGGTIAAPIAAWLVGRMPPQLLGIVVAGAILFTNTRTLIQSVQMSTPVLTGISLAIALLWVVALLHTLVRQGFPSRYRATDSTSRV